MGVDISKAKAKAAEEAAKQEARNKSFQSVIYWKPSQGKNKIRVMPPWTSDESNINANQFWREVYVHFSVGDNNSVFACPQKTAASPNDECPICEEVARLRSTRDPSDAEMAKDMAGKQRLYSNIVDLNDPTFTATDVKEWGENDFNKDKDCPFKAGDTKIQVFGYGPMIFKQLLDIFTENVDITDLANGYDISITRTGKDRNTEYQVTIVPPASQFVLTGQAIDDANIDLDELLPFQETEAIRAALTGAPPPPPAPKMAAPATAPALPPAPAPEVAAPEVAEEASVPTMAVAEEPAPECFKDPEVHDETDAECAGGSKDVDGEHMEFDPCPYLDACHKAVTKALEPEPPKKTRRRTTKPKAQSTSKPEPAVIPPPDDIDALEAEMKQVIS